jgi:hypothetical protein
MKERRTFTTRENQQRKDIKTKEPNIPKEQRIINFSFDNFDSFSFFGLKSLDL